MQFMQKNAIALRAFHARTISSASPRRYAKPGFAVPRALTKILFVMKLTFIFLTAFLLQLHANSYSQSVSLSVRNASLKSVFTEIEKQTGYTVFYNRDVLSAAKPVTVSLQNVALKDFLEISLVGQPVDFIIKDKFILLKQKTGPVAPQAAVAQAQAVQGMLKDEQGQPIADASVLLLPSRRVTTTNASGWFFFGDVAPGQHKLEISHMSFARVSQNVTVGNAAVTITITMRVSQLQLDGVTISTGYQKMDKNTITGSAAVITAKDIEKSPALNIMERLEGLVPGVRFDVRNNSIQIRTQNNFSGDVASRMPLIVIDGFPAIENTLVRNPGTELSRTSQGSNNSILSNFNPNDIESISFLKDAAASAIWGSRAANGVIVIETKKGRLNAATTVKLATALSFSQPADLSNLNVMSGKDYIEFEQELFDKNFFTDPASHWRNADVSRAQQIMFDAKNGKISMAERDVMLTELGKLDNKKQLHDYMLQSAVTQQYNLNVSGGSANAAYFVSGNYSKDRPVFKANSAESYYINANITNRFLRDRLSLATTLNQTYSKSEVNNAAIRSISPGTNGLRPYESILDLKYPMFTKAVTDSFTNMGYYSWTYNALDELTNSNVTYKKNATRITIALNGKVTDWFSLNASGAYQRNSNMADNLQKEYSYAAKQLVNEGTSRDASNGRLTYGVPKGAILKTSNTIGEDYSLRFGFDFHKQFGNMHNVSLIGGNEFRQARMEGYTQSFYGYDVISSTSAVVNPTTPYKTYLSTATVSQTKTLGYTDGTINRPITRYLSYYGSLNYAFMERYQFSGSVRFDDYTELGLERRKRAKPFWSGGFKWDIAKEPFMKDVKFIDYAALRLTIGTAGKVPGNGVPSSIFNYGGIDQLTQLPWGTIGTPGNPDLRWETSRTINEGLDLQVLDRRMTLTMDVYQRKSYGILVSLPINPTLGWTDLSYNTADMKSSGIEVGINGEVVRGKNWSWTAGINFAKTRTEVTDTRFGTNNVTSPNYAGILSGYPVDRMFAYKWAGLDDKGQSQVYNAKGEKVSSFAPTPLTIDDFEYMGHATPQTTSGMLQTVRYKNFTFTARITGYFGYKIFYDPINSPNVPSGTSASGYLSAAKALVERWRQPGDEAHTNIPGMANVNFNSLSWFSQSDINVIDGDNIRLQQLSLNYDLPSRALRATGFLKAVTLGATVGNVGLIWKKNDAGVDPMYIFTSDFNSLRPAPNYNFNLNVTF